MFTDFLKLTCSSLKMDGWKMIHVLLGFGLFSEAKIVSGSVCEGKLKSSEFWIYSGGCILTAKLFPKIL